MAHDDLEEWLEGLYELLPWQDSDSLSAEEIESASFMAQMNQQQ